MDGPNQNATPKTCRPYFLPAGMELEALPGPVRLAFEEVVAPCYDEMVLGAGSALERQAAISLVFLLAVEVLDQFAIGRELDFAQRRGIGESESLNVALDRYARVVGAKQKVAAFLLRRQEAQARQPFFPVV